MQIWLTFTFQPSTLPTGSFIWNSFVSSWVVCFNFHIFVIDRWFGTFVGCCIVSTDSSGKSFVIVVFLGLDDVILTIVIKKIF